jgi:hypothetical protein
VKTKKIEFLVITYVGSAKYGFYKDCTDGVARLQDSLAEYNLDLKIYGLSDLKSLVRFPDSNLFYFFTRYGAGAWFWKPILIVHALTTYKPKYLIYLDADCVLLKDPRIVIEESLRCSDVSLFKQNVPLEGWISKRALRKLDLTSSDARQMSLLTAGILLIRNSEDSLLFMNSWVAAMRNPQVLLSPMLGKFRVKHRHDQAVLSALVGKGELSCSIMSSGFHSFGAETLEENVAGAWVSTGYLTSTVLPMGYTQRLKSIVDYYSRIIYDFLKSILITPLHYLAYILTVKRRAAMQERCD